MIFDQVAMLGKLRDEELALSYGTTEVELVGENTMIITRRYFDQGVVIIINQSSEEVEFEANANLSSVFGNSSPSSDGIWTINPKSFDYLISN